MSAETLEGTAADDPLRQSSELYELLVLRVRDYAIFILDLQGNIITWNEGAELIKGYAPHEILGQHFSRFYSPEDVASGKPQEGLRVAGTAGRFEDQGWRVRKDGTKFFADVIITALRDASGQLRGYSKITRDITERRAKDARLLALAEELKRAEASQTAHLHQMRIKDEFLSHVSHELRSPLASIASFTSIIGDGLAGATNSKQDEYLAIVMKNVRQLQAMIEDLLEVTHAEKGDLALEPQQTYCAEAAQYSIETSRAVAEAKAIELSFDFDPWLPPVYADPVRLRQILTILLDNAIKFTPTGGSVALRISGFQGAGRFQLIEVEDNGCGMSPEFTERIFERMYQVPKEHQAGRRGLGLGLYIARQLALKMGGQIRVTSQPGRGSCFYVTMPVFSLEACLGSVLSLESNAVCTLFLFKISVQAGALNAEVTQEAARECRLLLKDCLRPEADALLPNICGQKRRGLFFVVCFSRLDSCDVVSGRMFAALRRSEELRQVGAHVSITHQALASASQAQSADDDRKARICAELQQHIDNACKGRENDGLQQEDSCRG